MFTKIKEKLKLKKKSNVPCFICGGSDVIVKDCKEIKNFNKITFSYTLKCNDCKRIAKAKEVWDI